MLKVIVILAAIGLVIFIYMLATSMCLVAGRSDKEYEEYLKSQGWDEAYLKSQGLTGDDDS